MEFSGDIERFAFSLVITAGLFVVLVAVFQLGYIRGWHLAIWRHRLGVTVVGSTVMALSIGVGWHLGFPIFTSAIAAAGYRASTLPGDAEPITLPESQELITVKTGTLVIEVPVNGKLVFPQSTELTFDTAGKVGEVLVQQGDRVVQGQVLARLNDLTTSTLEAELAKAEFDLDAAKEALQGAQKADFSNAPLQRAEFENEMAQAKKVLEDAQKRLRDFQHDYVVDLATATQNKADAEKALDEARRALGNIDRDRSQSLANARQLVADNELALETAQRNLANFEDDYQESVNKSMLQKANAEDALDVAEDNLTKFLRNPPRNIERGQSIDVELLRRLEAAVEEARSNLVRAENELVKLTNDRQLLLEERQWAVPVAEAALIEAKDDLAKLERDLDQNLDSQVRQADLEVAQARLARAAIDLQKEIEGPDQAELEVREKAVALAQERLNKVERPDTFDVMVKEAAVVAAKARADDALKRLEGATVRAPFDGIISLVNVETDDEVNDKSRVVEVVDPTQVEVDGLINAIDVQSVEEGAKARISIGVLPKQVFQGTVTAVAEQSMTERGVISYPVRIQVDLPEAMEVPVGLSGVTSEVIHEKKEVLLVPKHAVHRRSNGQVVLIMNGEGVIEERAVMLGHDNDVWAQVVHGLAEGEQLVVDAENAASPDGIEASTSKG